MQWCQRLDADYGVDPWIWQSLHGPSFHLSSKLRLCNSFHGCFVPILRKGKVSTLWSSFFLSFMCFANCILYLEDDVVGHQWKERPIDLANFICLSTGECQSQEVGGGVG